MSPTTQTLYQAKDFASRAGVTVRTLHLYDRIGLLTPAQRTGGGYRLYGAAELERLEQIVALRFVGFNLQDIKELLGARALPLISALRMQREIIRQRRKQLDCALAAIDRAESARIEGGEAGTWETLRTIIEVMKVDNNDWEWTKRYYSPQAQETIAARAAKTSPQELEEGQRAWTQLIAEVEEAAVNEDPAGRRAADLAARWKALVSQFTRGDAQVHEGLNKLWNDPTHWPAGFSRPWSDRADRFIRFAMNCNGAKP